MCHLCSELVRLTFLSRPLKASGLLTHELKIHGLESRICGCRLFFHTMIHRMDADVIKLGLGPNAKKNCHVSLQIFNTKEWLGGQDRLRF